MPRTYEQEVEYIERLSDVSFAIRKGFVPNMKVEGKFYVNKALEPLMFEELKLCVDKGGIGGFLPAVRQIANVAALPGIVGHSIGLPDIHSGYGFSIGNVAAFDAADRDAVVSPGGVGFDINCGVRLIRTSLNEKDVVPFKEELAQSLFDHIPVGVGSRGVIPMKARDFEECLEMGMDWTLREGYSWVEDKEHCEEHGRMLQADASKVSTKAKKRGLPQAFAKIFDSTPDDLDMHVVYDVSHNVAKLEEHWVEGRPKQLCVHRKGATRAFPAHHPLIPVDYQLTGQPVLIGGSMGTCSYVLTGTEHGFQETFGTTCHGAGRALSRAKSRRNIGFEEVLDSLKSKGISIRVASPKLIMEEAPEAYKNVVDVVDTCQAAGISNKAIKLRPIAVIKG